MSCNTCIVVCNVPIYVCACVLLYHPIWCTRIIMYVLCKSARVFITVTYSMRSGRLGGSCDTFPSRRLEQYNGPHRRNGGNDDVYT